MKSSEIPSRGQAKQAASNSPSNSMWPDQVIGHVPLFKNNRSKKRIIDSDAKWECNHWFVLICYHTVCKAVCSKVLHLFDVHWDRMCTIATIQADRSRSCWCSLSRYEILLRSFVIQVSQLMCTTRRHHLRSSVCFDQTGLIKQDAASAPMFCLAGLPYGTPQVVQRNSV